MCVYISACIYVYFCMTISEFFTVITLDQTERGWQNCKVSDSQPGCHTAQPLCEEINILLPLSSSCTCPRYPSSIPTSSLRTVPLCPQQPLCQLPLYSQDHTLPWTHKWVEMGPDPHFAAGGSCRHVRPCKSSLTGRDCLFPFSYLPGAGMGKTVVLKRKTYLVAVVPNLFSLKACFYNFSECRVQLSDCQLGYHDVHIIHEGCLEVRPKRLTVMEVGTGAQCYIIPRKRLQLKKVYRYLMHRQDVKYKQ